jgi:outer membrane lipoprotein
LRVPALVLLLLLVGGCASNPASSISSAVVDDVALVQVQHDTERYTDSIVRWGGIITEVDNKADRTWVLMVARALVDDEKPIADGASDGRFIASFQGFIDPLVYKPGRPLTVVGRVEGSTVRAIGEYEYRFPIIEVRDSHLWSEPSKTRVYYPPPPFWYYDMPYYYPYPYRHPRW